MRSNVQKRTLVLRIATPKYTEKNLLFIFDASTYSLNSQGFVQAFHSTSAEVRSSRWQLCKLNKILAIFATYNGI